MSGIGRSLSGLSAVAVSGFEPVGTARDDAPIPLRGIEITRLGKRHKAEPVIKLTTPRGESAYWIGPAGGAADTGPGTDFHAVDNQRVSVTPLRMDLTHVAQLSRAREWLAR